MGQPTVHSDSATANRLEAQKRAIVELAKDKSLFGSDFESAMRKITERAAEVLQAEVVSVWLFNEDGTRMKCVDLFERSKKAHSSGFEAETGACPLHVRALDEGRTIPANDARADPRTNELNDAFIVPFGISSMLDATVRVQGKMVAAICHAHVGPARQWTPDEEHFAGSMADLIGQVLAR